MRQAKVPIPDKLLEAGENRDVHRDNVMLLPELQLMIREQISTRPDWAYRSDRVCDPDALRARLIHFQSVSDFLKTSQQILNNGVPLRDLNAVQMVDVMEYNLYDGSFSFFLTQVGIKEAPAGPVGLPTLFDLAYILRRVIMALYVDLDVVSRQRPRRGPHALELHLERSAALFIILYGQQARAWDKPFINQVMEYVETGNSQVRWPTRRFVETFGFQPMPNSYALCTGKKYWRRWDMVARNIDRLAYALCSSPKYERRWVMDFIDMCTRAGLCLPNLDPDRNPQPATLFSKPAADNNNNMNNNNNNNNNNNQQNANVEQDAMDVEEPIPPGGDQDNDEEEEEEEEEEEGDDDDQNEDNEDQDDEQQAFDAAAIADRFYDVLDANGRDNDDADEEDSYDSADEMEQEAPIKYADGFASLIGFRLGLLHQSLREYLTVLRFAFRSDYLSDSRIVRETFREQVYIARFRGWSKDSAETYAFLLRVQRKHGIVVDVAKLVVRSLAIRPASSGLLQTLLEVCTVGPLSADTVIDDPMFNASQNYDQVMIANPHRLFLYYPEILYMIRNNMFSPIHFETMLEPYRSRIAALVLQFRRQGLLPDLPQIAVAFHFKNYPNPVVDDDKTFFGLDNPYAGSIYYNMMTLETDIPSLDTFGQRFGDPTEPTGLVFELSVCYANIYDAPAIACPVLTEARLKRLFDMSTLTYIDPLAYFRPPADDDAFNDMINWIENSLMAFDVEARPPGSALIHPDVRRVRVYNNLFSCLNLEAASNSVLRRLAAAIVALPKVSVDMSIRMLTLKRPGLWRFVRFLIEAMLRGGVGTEDLEKILIFYTENKLDAEFPTSMMRHFKPGDFWLAPVILMTSVGPDCDDRFLDLLNTMLNFRLKDLFPSSDGLKKFVKKRLVQYLAHSPALSLEAVGILTRFLSQVRAIDPALYNKEIYIMYYDTTLGDLV